MILEEIQDGFTGLVQFDLSVPLDMNGQQIRQLADGIEDDDAINLGQARRVFQAIKGGAIITYSDQAEPTASEYPEGTKWLVIDTNAEYTQMEGFWVEDGKVGDNVDVTAASHLTLAQAQASDLKVGQYVRLTDCGNTLYQVVDASDTGKYYITTLASGRKLGLIDKEISCSGLGMTEGVGQDNSAVLNALDTFDWDSLDVDGYYEFTSNVVNVMPDRKVKLHGSGELHGVSAYITFQGQLVDYGQIISADAKGSKYLAVTNTAGLSSGDIIIIHNQNDYSYSPHRPEYHEGEFNVIKSVDGVSVLTTENSLKAYYGSLTNIKMYKLNPVILECDTKITTTGSAIYALAVKYGATCKFDSRANIRAELSANAVGALLVDKLFGCEFKGGRFFNDAPANGTQYGINISSCANVYGFGLVEAHAARHGIATGSDGTSGGVPCDNIWFHKSRISNDGNAIYSADFHGNTRNSGYVSCEIDNDVGIGGENITIDGNTIIAKRANPPLELQEIVGGEIRITNNIVKLGEGFNFNTLVAFSSSTLSQNVSKDFNLTLKDNEFELNAGVTEIVTMLYNQTLAVKSTFTFDGFSLSGNTSGLTKYASLNRLGAGLNPYQVHISEDKFTLDAPASYVTLSGSFVGTKFNLPSQRCPSVPLTILSGQSESTKGGSGDTGIYVWDYVNYPSIPHISVDHTGWARAGDPQLFMAIETAASNSCQIFSTTAANSMTVGADRTLTINAEVRYSGVVL